MLDSLGYRSPGVMAWVNGIAETLAGLLLVLGLLTPIGCVVVIAVMTNAILAVHAPRGFWNTHGGFEFPLTLLAVAAALGFTGPGRISIDKSIGWVLRGPVPGIVVLVAGIIAGIAFYLLGRHRRDEVEETTPIRPAA
jgi:putative oxidoreductase